MVGYIDTDTSDRPNNSSRLNGIHGIHSYMEDWTPTIGESLLVKPEPTKAKDNKAVAVLKDD